MVATEKASGIVRQRNCFFKLNLTKWIIKSGQALGIISCLTFGTGCQPLRQQITCVPSDATATSQGALPTVDIYLPDMPDTLEPITVANAGRLQLIRSIQMPQGSISKIAYSPTGEQMAIKIRLEERRSRTYILSQTDQMASFHLPDVETAYTGDLAWTQENNLLRSANKTLELWNISSRQLLCQSQTLGSEITDIEFSPDNKFFALTSVNGDIYLARQEQGQVIKILDYYNSPFNDADFSPDSKWLVTSTPDNQYQLWQADNGQQIWSHEFIYDNHSVGSPEVVEFSPTNDVIALGSWPIGLADSATGEITQNLLGHVPLVSQLAFTGAGDILIANAEGEVLLWNVSDGSLLTRLTVSQGIRYIDLRADNKVLVIVSEASHEVQFWAVTE